MPRRVWTLLGMVLALSALLWFRAGRPMPLLWNDSYQYLDAAESLVSTGSLATHIAHFDEQLAFGRLPVPFTHFAPGYPLLIGLLHRLGLTAAAAADLLSALGFLFTVFLFWDAGFVLRLPPFALLLAQLLWVTNVHALRYSASALTESLFTAAFTATGVALLRHLHLGQASMLLWAGLAGGLCYAFRYAGIFVLPVVLLFFAIRAWQDHRLRRPALAGSALALLLVVPILVRNILYTGSWRGGFSSSGSNSPLTVLRESVKAFFHLLVGDQVPFHFDLLGALALFASLWFAFRLLRSRPFPIPPATVWLCLLGLAYAGGIMLAMLTSIAADLTRYYLPLYPLLLLAAASLFPLSATRLDTGAALLLTVSLLALHLRNFSVVQPPSPDRQLALLLQSELTPAQSAQSWLLERLRRSPTQPILATDGQATQYVLRHPVVSLIEPIFTATTLEPVALEALMRRFGARYLLLYPRSAATQIQQQSPALQRILAGAPPPWLKLAAHNSQIAIWECASCSPLPAPDRLAR